MKHMRIFNKIMSVVLALTMVLSMLPMTVFATQTEDDVGEQTAAVDLTGMTDEEVAALCAEFAQADDTAALEAVVAQLEADEDATRYARVEAMVMAQLDIDAVEGDVALIADAPASVSVYKQVNTVTEKQVDLKYYEYVGTATDLENAVTKLNAVGANGGLIELSEGTLTVTNRQDITKANVIIKGAGKNATTLTGNASKFNNKTNGLNSSNLSSEYKALLGISAENVKVMDMAIDGGECGVKPSGFAAIFTQPEDFKTVRVNGCTAYLEDLVISGKNARTTLMVGTSTGAATVHANGVTVNKPSALLSAATEQTYGSYLDAEGSLLEGIVLGSGANLGAGYYEVTYSGVTAYTTIPYAIEIYENGLLTPGFVNAQTTAQGTTVAEAMTADLTTVIDGSTTLLYGKDCDEMKALAGEFKDALAGLSAATNVTVQNCLSMLDNALAVEQWHNVSAQGECAVCGKTGLEAPSVPGEDNASGVVIPDTVTGDVVDEIKANTALQGYEPKNVPDGAELVVELKEASVDKIVYNVAPMQDGNKVQPAAGKEVAFRLPVPAAVTETFAEIYHDGAFLQVSPIRGEGSNKYVEVKSSSFSEFAVEPGLYDKGYYLTIYNGDGTVGMDIDATKSVSAFSLRTAIEDARVFANNGFLFGITGTPSFVVDMFEDSTEDKSFEIGADVTINGNGHNIVLAEGVVLTNKGTINNATVIEPEVPEVPAAVKIGDAEFATLADALAAAKTMTGDVTVEIFDKVTLSDAVTGSFESIKFVGKDTDAEIYMDIQGAIYATGKTVAFEDLTLSKSVGGYVADAGFRNLAFGLYAADEVTYTNCVFANGAYASGNETFTNCEFHPSHDRYGLWVYGADTVLVDGCTFAEVRGIKMYNEAKTAMTDLTVKNTDFTNADGKPAIVLTYGESVTLENNTYSSKGVFELDLDGKPNGTAVTSDVAPTCINDNGACGVLVDGKIYTTAAQAAAVAASGSNVTLLHDSAETVEFAEGVNLNKNGFAAAGVTVKQSAPPVAEINGATYTSLAAAVEAAQAGDVITVIADIADETVSVDKNVTITGSVTANNVSISAVDGCASLTVSGLTFTGNSWINSGSAEKLTVSGVTANVIPSNAAQTNSRSAFISLGRSEQQSLELVVEDSNIVSAGGSDPILGWACITKATLTGNTFGSADAHQNNSDSVKFMSIADGAEFTITGNTVYSDYNGIVFAQNTTRGNAYTANISGNTFMGTADHIWIEISGGDTCHATVNAASDNTVNGNGFTAADIKAHTGVIKNWTSYAGVDVETNAEGKVIGGTLAFSGDDVIAEGYEKDATGKVVPSAPAAPAYVAEVNGVGYATLSEAFAAVTDDYQDIVILSDVTEELTGAYLRGNITTKDGAKVTITLTNSDWVYMPYTFVVGENVTLKVPYMFYYAGGTQINGTVIAGAYYQRYTGTKLTINEPGSLTVNTEMFYLRYMDGDPNAGIYVVGDNDDSTVGLNLSVAYFYQGMINAKDATIQTAVYWQTNETDGTGSANLVLDNTKMTVTGSELDSAATGNSTVTLTNGSILTCAGNFVTGDNTAVSVDATSKIVVKGQELEFGLSGKGTETDPYLINNVADLIKFRDSVNNGETKYSAPGVYVALGADIDLTGENWVGIGSAYKDHGFMGNFDGKGFKVKNLTITNPAVDSDGYAYAGLFAVTEGTDANNQNVIKNLIIENVTISTTGHIVSAAIAYPYYTKVENIKVCGNIAITGGDYTAGALAYTRRCVNASNVTVSGNAGSTITGTQVVGGVISDIQMNGGLTANYSNFAVSGVTITGGQMVGGISGIIATQSLNGASVKDVELVCTDRVGIYAGSFGGTSTISNATYSNVEGATVEIGGTYKDATPVAAKVNDTYYGTFAEAWAAANAGDTITLLADLTLASKLVVDKNVTIDGNGHSIIANHTAFILETGSDCTIKNVTLDTNNKAKGVKIASGNVVFDNVTIPNSTKSDAVTVAAGSTLTLKTYFKAVTTYSVVDARGSINAEPGTVFDMTSWRATASPATSDLKGAVDVNGKPFFCAYGSTTYYKSLSSVATTITDLTLLDDVSLSSNLTVKGTLNLNGHDLTLAEGKALKAGGNLNIVGEGNIDADLVLTSANHTVTAPEGLNVTTTVADHKVVYANGVYSVVEEAADVAKIGDVKYATLADAVAAVQDGGTITLLSDVIFNTQTRTHNSGSWYDGLYYIGDKSFTIDLAGFTIGQDGSVNDYLLNFKNAGAKANTIVLKNGTIDAGMAAYCAICTSSTSTQQITIDLEDVNLINNNSNGSTAKIRGGAVLNVKDGAVITGQNSYLAIECVASTVNIYDGAEIYMNGTASYNGCLVGACGNGVVNVYGGYGKGAKGGFIAMTSGGTINVAGGEWIANTDGTVGTNSNEYVLTAQNNTQETGYAGASIINVTGGTFRGGMDAWVIDVTKGEVAELNISGGNFNADPTTYVDTTKYTVDARTDGTYLVGQLPDADVENLGKITVKNNEGDYKFDGSYYIYDLINGGKMTTATAPFDLTIAMDFTAKDSAEQAAANAFGQYTTDFYITMDGMENGSFVGDGCYLAGYYKSFGAWVLIPLDGFTVEDGKAYPVITSAGFDFSYEMICSDVKQFVCGIYLTPEVLEANPNLTVDLALGLSENKEAALNANFVTVDNYVYDADDLMPEAKLFGIYNSNMILDNSLAMNFYVKKSDIVAGEKYYIQVTKPYADGRADVVRIYEQEEWQNYSTDLYRVTFDGIAAKEMSDQLRVQVFYEDGTEASKVWVESIRDYAMFMLKQHADDKWGVLMVDMLNYGAAAQNHFKYAQDDLANKNLTAEQQKLATEKVTATDHFQAGENGMFYNSTLVLNSNIVLNMYFKNVEADEGMYAKVAYTNHYGKAVNVTVPFAEFDQKGEGIYAVPVDELVVADGYQVVTIELYAADGTLLDRGAESVESYIYAMRNSEDPLFEMILKFITSAKASFAKN